MTTQYTGLESFCLCFFPFAPIPFAHGISSEEFFKEVLVTKVGTTYTHKDIEGVNFSFRVLCVFEESTGTFENTSRALSFT